jgi:hypothetical protein
MRKPIWRRRATRPARPMTSSSGARSVISRTTRSAFDDSGAALE